MKDKTSKTFRLDYPLFALLALALIIRLLYLMEIARHNPYFYSENLVAEVHHRWAKDIVEGNKSFPEPYIRAPLYPYYLALVYEIIGADTFYPRLLQLLIGVLLTYPIYLTGKKLFGRKGGLLSAGIWALYGPEIFFEGELFETSLTVFLIFTAYLCWDKGERSGKIRWLALAGLILGLATVMKPNSALFFPLLVIWLLFKKESSAFKSKALGLFAFGFFLTIAPVTIRNFAVSGEFVPVSTYGGLNFYIGNNAQSDGVSAILPDMVETAEDEQWGREHHSDALTALSIRKASEAAGKPLNSKESSDYWWKQTVKFAKAQPGKFLLLNLRKLALFCNSYEFGNTRDLYFSRNHSFILSALLWNWGINLPYGIIFPFAVMGLIYLYQIRAPGRGTIAIFLIGATLSVTIIFVCSRFRAPILPFLIILAGGGFVETFKGLNGRKLLTNLALIVPLLILVNIDFFRQQRDVSDQEYHNLGQKYWELGQYQNAYDSFQKSYRANPEFTPTLTALGLLFENSNEYSISAFYYRQVLSQIPNDPVAHYNLGAVEGKAGNLETALTELAKAVELDSNFWQAWINLGNVFFHRKDYKNAEASYLRALDIIPDSPDVFYNLANYYMVTGDTTKAVIYYQRVEELAPEYPSVAEILSRLKSGAQ